MKAKVRLILVEPIEAPEPEAHPKKSCGFCGEKFRSKRQRNDHTNKCKE